jgi:hypothetical protein
MTEKPPRKKPHYNNLYGWWEYKKYAWFEDAAQAKHRYEYLSAVWDEPHVSSKDKQIISKEMEIICDYFDWLQIVL